MLHPNDQLGAPAPRITKVTANGQLSGPAIAYVSSDGFVAWIGLTLDQNIAWNAQRRAAATAAASAPASAPTRLSSREINRADIPRSSSRYSCAACRREVRDPRSRWVDTADHGEIIAYVCPHCDELYRV